MKLHIAGGVGEHGRSCFFVEGAHATFIVDCGLMPGSETPYPHLTDKQILAARYLFITHSHLDHTGAFPWLVEHGFSGCVIMTRETAGQVSFTPERVCIIDETVPTLSDTEWTDDLAVRWGRSGHCAGSVWYAIKQNGQTMLFSGDYVEDTLAYRCDPLRGIQAEMAVLDSAYGNKDCSPAAYREELVKNVKTLAEQGKRIVFPVPRYGRGLELLVLFHKHFPHIHISMDRHLQNELSRVDEVEDWLKPESYLALKEMQNKGYASANSDESAFVFLCDPQLKTLEGQKLAMGIANENGSIILTGNTDTGSSSERLLRSGIAVFFRYSVHMSHAERERLENLNVFSKTVPYHCGNA